MILCHYSWKRYMFKVFSKYTHIGSCMTDKQGSDSCSNVTLSCIVVLMLSSLPYGNINNQTKKGWDNDMH